MNYLDSTEYPAGTTFSQERLRQITPEDLVRYLNYEVYGNETPADDDEAQIRSSTVEFWKKALSYFMPNRMMVWNEIAGVGNPTRYALVNQLIKVMKRKEVCGQGQSSRALRPLNDNEARRMNMKLKQEKDNLCQYGVNAAINFQVHMNLITWAR